jgi:iron complex outermembrane recepter protein
VPTSASAQAAGAGGAPAAPAEDSPGAPPTQPEVKAPELVTFVPAKYPVGALEQRLEADVVLKLTIDAEGKVTAAAVTTGAGNGFDEAALEAASQFRFRPAERGGQAVAARILYRYEFRLPEKSGTPVARAPDTFVVPPPVPEGAVAAPVPAVEPSAPVAVPPVPAADSPPVAAPPVPAPAAPTAPSAPIDVSVRGKAVGNYQAGVAAAATKTNTRLLELPQAVQVVPRQVLADQQVVEVREVLENVSGVQSSGRDRAGLVDLFYTRGFRLNPDRNFYKNGRPFVFSLSPPAETLDRVEFVKGPASVLYGQAEPGGIVNLVLKRPPVTAFAQSTLQVGSYGWQKVHLDAGAPLSESVGARVNVARTSADSFRDFQHMKQTLAAAAVTWRPTRWFELATNASGQWRVQTADSGLAGGPSVDGVLGNRVVALPRSRLLNELWTNLDIAGGEVGYTATVHLAQGVELRQSGSWQRQENDELRADPLEILPRIPTQGIRRGDLAKTLRDRHAERRTLFFDVNLLTEFGSGPVEHKLLAGLDAFDLIAGFTEYQPVITDAAAFNVVEPVYARQPPAILGDNLLRLSRGTLSQMGGYVQEQLDLYKMFHLLGGVRADVFKDGLEQSRFDTAAFTFVDQVQRGVTWRGGALFNPVPTAALFGNYSQGFRPNVDPFSNEQLSPERSEQWEAGGKLALFREALLITVTGFELRKTNVVVVNPVSQVLNLAGERRARGVELDVVGDLLPGWSLLLNYSALDAEVTKNDPRAAGTAGVGTESIQGNTPPGSPRHSGRLWTSYRFPPEVLSGLRVGAGVFGRTEVQGDLFNTIQLPGYTRFDAMLGHSSHFGRLGVNAQINFKNLGDVVYFEGENRNFIRPGEPFTVLADLTLRLEAPPPGAEPSLPVPAPAGASVSPNEGAVP